MKLDNIKDNETRVIGDIGNISVSVSEDKMDMVVSLLTTNLYSDKQSSLVREITSNAWDSHVACKNDNPIVLGFNEDSKGNIFLSIRDFGTGLSEQEFDDVYRKLGTSTKTGSDDYIGGFGIGKFSALAYAEKVEINSYYNGTKYTYMMYRDGLKIMSPLISTTETEDPNGLEVIVPVENKDISIFVDSIYRQLVYFENLIIENNTNNSLLESLETTFNTLITKDFGTFKLNSYNSNENLYTRDACILLGKVLYPINNSLIGKYNMDTALLIRKLDDSSVAIKFNVGELKVTPNREEIQYDEKTVKLIHERALETVNFLQSEVDKFYNKDVEDILTYKALTDRVQIVPLDETSNFNIKTSNFNSSTTNLKYNGVHIPKKIIDVLFSISPYYYHITYPFHEKASCTNLKFSESKVENKIDELNRLHKRDYLTNFLQSKKYNFGNNPVFHHSKPTFKKLEKDYFKSITTGHYSTNIYSLNISKPEAVKRVWYKLMENVRNTWKGYNFRSQPNNYLQKKDIPYLKHIFKSEIIPLIEKEYDSIVDTNEDTINETWIEKYKEEQAKNKKKVASKDYINCHVYRYSDNGTSYSSFDVQDILVEEVCKLNKIVIYDEKSSDKLKAFAELLHADTLKPNKECQVSIIGIAKSKLNQLEDYTNTFTVEEFMKSDHKTFKKFCTALIIAEDLKKNGFTLDYVLNYKTAYENHLKTLKQEDVDNILKVINYLHVNKGFYSVLNSQLGKDLISIGKKENKLDYAMLNTYNAIRTKLFAFDKYYGFYHGGTTRSDVIIKTLGFELSMYKKELSLKPDAMLKLKKSIYG